MHRFHQLLLIGTFLPLCWLGMMAVHELGHVLGAVASGGTVERVVLHPLAISRTDVSPNPRPLVVVWSGPLIGVLLPLTLFVIAKFSRFHWAYLVQFFAGFCLIANGAYLGADSFVKGGDGREMLWHGSPVWSLWLFAVVTFPGGLCLWNGLGPRFGLGQAAGRVEHPAAYISLAVLLLTVLLELVFS
jgi:hypothetical protein